MLTFGDIKYLTQSLKVINQAIFEPFLGTFARKFNGKKSFLKTK